MSLEFLTAQKIAELAFGTAVKTGVGKLTEGAMPMASKAIAKLGNAIKHRFQNHQEATAAITVVENEPTPANVQGVVPFLREAMQDQQFAQEIDSMAREIMINKDDNSTHIKTGDNSPVNLGHETKTVKISKIDKLEGGINLS